MGLFRKKNKQKKKFTTDTLVKILMPLFLLGLIVYFGYTVLQDYKDISNEYSELVSELSKVVDEELLLTDNAIMISDKTTMIEKIKATGLSDILINEEVSGNIYTNTSLFELTASLDMTDCEWGVLSEIILNYTNYRDGLDLKELSITQTVSGRYKIYAVGLLDVSNITKEIKGLESITKLYVSSSAYIELVDGELKYTECTSRVNMLDDNYNAQICRILNASYLVGTDDSVLIPQIVQFFNDFAAKTMSTPSLGLHNILMNLEA